MLIVQVSRKNSIGKNWDSVAYYKTRRGANNFIVKNKALYPEDVFDIRIIGEEEQKPEFLNCHQVTKIGDVFIEECKDEFDYRVRHNAYVVVGLTPSGKTLKVKKLTKVYVGDATEYRDSLDWKAWKAKFVKPSDEFMQNGENVKKVRLLDYEDSVIFYTDSHKIADFYVEGNRVVEHYADSVEIAKLDKKFNYNNVYIEGLYEEKTINVDDVYNSIVDDGYKKLFLDLLGK